MESLELLPIRVRVASIIRKAIYSGEYKAGEELSLTETANKLGISRTPVREAFQTLAAEGLITLRMNKGAIVNKIDRKFIQDSFDMRVLLESEAAALAARNGMETKDLTERLEKMEQQQGEMDREEYEQLNSELHMRIWNAADNQKLKSYLMDLWNGPSTGHSVPERKEHYAKSTKEHLKILEKIAERDEEGARAEMAAHIRRSEQNILNQFDPEKYEQNQDRKE